MPLSVSPVTSLGAGWTTVRSIELTGKAGLLLYNKASGATQYRTAAHGASVPQTIVANTFLPKNVTVFPLFFADKDQTEGAASTPMIRCGLKATPPVRPAARTPAPPRPVP